MYQKNYIVNYCFVLKKKISFILYCINQKIKNVHVWVVFNLPADPKETFEINLNVDHDRQNLSLVFLII